MMSPEILEHWIPLTPIEKMAQTDYDVIIVGSGAGGGAALWRLCDRWRKSGKRIAVLEAGDLILPTHALNLPTFDHNRLNQFFANPKIAQPIGKNWPEYPGAKQFWGLGGKTLHWGTVTPRFNPAQFKDWPISYKELIPYYVIAERIMKVNQNYTIGSSLQEILLDRLQIAGYFDATSLPLATDREISKYGEIHSNVFFSSIIFFAIALNLGSFDLAVNARTVQVFVENGKAAAVKVVTPDKKSHYIKGKVIILSAGSFQNPRILLYSGIHGDAVGRFLVNHSFVMTTAKTNRKQFPEVLGNTGIMIPSSDNRAFQLQVHGTDPFDYYWYQYKERPFQEELKFSLIGFGKVEPRFDNQVRIDPNKRDEYGIPKLDVHFSYSQQDQEVIRQMLASTIHVVKSMKLSLETNPCLMPTGSEYHESGTCRMGDHPSTSTTNRYGQLHGVPGLFVADSSVMPSIGATNPTLTIVALAIRTADYIIHSLK